MNNRKDVNKIRERLFIAEFSNKAAKRALEYGCSLEINRVCISENLDKDRIEQTKEQIIALIKAAGCTDKRVFMHAPFTELTPDAMDHRALELTQTRYEEAIDLCVDLEINDIVFHSGYIPKTYYKEWHHDRSVKFFKAFCRNLPKGMNIYIENVLDDEPYMMLHLIEDIGLPEVKACLDVGHANVASLAEYGIFDWINVLKPVLGHTHLHNNDGKKDLHAPLNSGRINMEQAIREIVGLDGVTMTIESTESKESLDWLFSLFD